MGVHALFHETLTLYIGLALTPPPPPNPRTRARTAGEEVVNMTTDELRIGKAQTQASIRGKVPQAHPTRTPATVTPSLPKNPNTTSLTIWQKKARNLLNDAPCRKHLYKLHRAIRGGGGFPPRNGKGKSMRAHREECEDGEQAQRHERNAFATADVSPSAVQREGLLTQRIDRSRRDRLLNGGGGWGRARRAITCIRWLTSNARLRLALT